MYLSQFAALMAGLVVAGRHPSGDRRRGCLHSLFANCSRGNTRRNPKFSSVRSRKPARISWLPTSSLPRPSAALATSTPVLARVWRDSAGTQFRPEVAGSSRRTTPTGPAIVKIVASRVVARAEGKAARRSGGRRDRAPGKACGRAAKPWLHLPSRPSCAAAGFARSTISSAAASASCLPRPATTRWRRLLTIAGPVWARLADSTRRFQPICDTREDGCARCERRVLRASCW